mmetsp:Transcript_28171/g.46665  ORF Transcript_28171/g.46665 Transcript_28171/m.46665 type:complete len:236 (-) Transcript_28171:35-742(-)
MFFGRSIWPKYSQRSQSLIQIVVKCSNFFEELLSNIVSMKSTGGRQDGKFRKSRKQVNLSFISGKMFLEVLPCLLFNLGHVGFERGNTKTLRNGLKLCLTVLTGCIVHDTRSKDSRHERVHGILAQNIIRRLAKEFLGFWTNQHGHALGTERYGKDRSVRFVTALHHFDGPFTEFQRHGERTDWTGQNERGRILSSATGAEEEEIHQKEHSSGNVKRQHWRQNCVAFALFVGFVG